MPTPTRPLDAAEPEAWNGSEHLVCPACHARLTRKADELACTGCDARYPVIGRMPVLLTSESGFAADEVVSSAGTYFEHRINELPLKRRVRNALPSLGLELGSPQLDQLVREQLSGVEAPVGLALGAGTRPGSFAARFPTVEWIVTDVDGGYGVDAVADAHGLPLPDASIDLVVTEHVMEHLLNPMAAAAEIERVLRPGGIVLAKIPFLFPWHGGYLDFFRVTPAGMRALFAGCDVVHLAPSMGPASAVAYATSGTATAAFSDRIARVVVLTLSRLLLAPLKHLDRWLIGRTSSAGVAAHIAFVGRRATRRRSNHELIADARAIGQGRSLT